MSFKYSSFEGERNGRYFIAMTEEGLSELIKKIQIIEIEELSMTSDVRMGR